MVSFFFIIANWTNFVSETETKMEILFKFAKYVYNILYRKEMPAEKNINK